jgi:F0F1-type ATP synthase delta subunit
MKAERLAQVLHSMTAHTSAVDSARAYTQWSAYLKARGLSSLLPRILHEYSRIAQKNKRPGVVVTLAQKQNAKTAISNIVAEHALEGDVETRIDETIIGGYQIETESRLIDASHKSALLAIYHRITK